MDFHSILENLRCAYDEEFKSFYREDTERENLLYVLSYIMMGVTDNVTRSRADVRRPGSP